MTASATDRRWRASRLLKKSSRAVSALNRLIAAHEEPFVYKGFS